MSRGQSRLGILMIGICMTALLYKYLLQIFPSVMTDNLMHMYHLNGVQMGNLAACFFYGYVFTQVFAGFLVDRFGNRTLASLSLFIAAIGVVIFAMCSNLYYIGAGRILMGVGSAFATICYLRCTANWCTAKTIAFAGGCLTIGVMVGACLAQAPLALSIQDFGMVHSLLGIAFIGFLLAGINACFLRDKKSSAHKKRVTFADVKTLFTKKQNWILAGYSGFAFAPLAVFGGLWGTPFMQAAHHFDKPISAGLVSLCYVGFGFGGPIFGYLSDKRGFRQRWMIIGLVTSMVFLLFILYVPTDNKIILSFFMLGLGFGTGSFMLGFTIGKETNSLILAGSIVAFINSGDALLGAISEPLIGKVLDNQSPHSLYFTAPEFRIAFMLLMGYLIISLVFAILYRKS